jgi:hypothetical protein
LFIPQIIYEYGERRWNDIDRGKPKNSEKTCPTLSTTNPTWIDPGANTGLRGKRPANHLNHGTALRKIGGIRSRDPNLRDHSCVFFVLIFKYCISVVRRKAIHCMKDTNSTEYMSLTCLRRLSHVFHMKKHSIIAFLFRSQGHTSPTSLQVRTGFDSQTRKF